MIKGSVPGHHEEGMEQPSPVEEAPEYQSYRTQIAAIEAKLQRGTEIIKQNHKIAGVNPEGDAVEVPLTHRQVERLEWNLGVLRFHLENGSGIVLPHDFRATNPQITTRDRQYYFWKFAAARNPV